MSGDLIVTVGIPPLVTDTGQCWWTREFPIASNLKAWRWWVWKNLTSCGISGMGCGKCGARAPAGKHWPVFFWHQLWWRAHVRVCPRPGLVGPPNVR